MKCDLCKFEVEAEPPKEPAALSFATNAFEQGADFGAIFGFWDQRDKQRFDICGACLVENLRKLATIIVCMPSVSMDTSGIIGRLPGNPIPLAIGSNECDTPFHAHDKDLGGES